MGQIVSAAQIVPAAHNVSVGQGVPVVQVLLPPLRQLFLPCTTLRQRESYLLLTEYLPPTVLPPLRASMPLHLSLQA